MRLTRAHRFLVPLALTLGVAAAGNAPSLASADEVVARISLDRTLEDRAIRESSGLARSTFDRPLVWTHNDSGDGARVFAVGKNGSTRGIVRLEGAGARDWEDISTGPGHTVWVGDIGDNGRRRSSISVYRFNEPSVPSSRTVKATRFDLRYPDGKHDAEGLMVRPGNGRVFVVSKSRSGGHLYRAPKRLSATSANRLEKLTSVPKSITAAAWAPRGRRFVVSNHNWAYLYDGLRDSRPTEVRKPATRQGESMDFARGGRALLVGSEGVKSPVYKLRLP
jgi:hypothetical protein